MSNNLPFHPWIRGYESLQSNPNYDYLAQVQRGYIRTDPEIHKNEDKQTPNRRLHFLYNPSTLNLSFSVDPEMSDAQYITRKDGGQQAPLSPMQQTFNLELLFDRTYEVSYPNAAGFAGEEISREGVWRDIRAAAALVGVLDEVFGDPYQMPASGFATQAMVQYPCYVHFGTGSQALTIFGIPTGLGVSITHWGRDMIPIRAAIALGFQIMPRYDLSVPETARDTTGDEQGLLDMLNPMNWFTGTGGLSVFTTGSNTTTPAPTPTPTPSAPVPGGINRPTPSPSPTPMPSPTPNP